MGILGRLSNVIKSNVNALIDQAEDPAKMLDQTLDDMRTEIAGARKEVVIVVAQVKVLEKKRAQLEADAKAWEDKAVLALEGGDEELAKEALKRKQKSLAEAQNADRARADQEAYSDELKRAVDQLEQKMEDVKSRKATLASQLRRSRQAPGVEPGQVGARFASGSLAELERMAGQIDQMEAEIEVHNVLDDPKRAEVERRLADLEGSRVDDELAALKRKLGK